MVAPRVARVRILVRPATDDDVQTLARFNRRIAIETEGVQLPLDQSICGVRHGIAQGEEVTYLVAQGEDGDVVGSLMLTREWSDWRDGWCYWLQSVYVVPPARGRGVFGALLESAIGRLKARGDVCRLRLYVEHDNQTAQAAYSRTRFRDAGYRVMERDLE